MERRVYRIDELRADSQGEDLIIQGRGVAYGRRSVKNVPMPGAREVISQGCFRDSLASDDNIILDVNHNEFMLPLAATRNQSLRLQEKTDGLYFRAALDPAITSHRDVHQLVKTGTLGECSFEFSGAVDDWSDERDPETGERYALRTVRSAKLGAISLVSKPAYADGCTFAEARSRLRRLTRSMAEAGIYGFRKIRFGTGTEDMRYEPITDANIQQFVDTLGKELAEDLERFNAAEARREDEKRYHTKAILTDPNDPRWGGRIA